MKKAISIFLMILIPSLCFSQNANQQIIDKINTAASKLTTMQCDFVQTKHVKLLNDKMISKGKMYYSQPNKLRWEYTSPYTYTFILSGNKVTLKKGGKNSVINVNQNKMFREIVNIMMNSVVGKCLSDRKSFKTTVKDTPSEWVATLTPQSKELKQMFTKIILHFNKQKSVIVKVEMFEKNGDTTSIVLENIVKNKNINESVYSIH